MRYTQPDAVIVNDATIVDGVILDAARIKFTNTAAGRVIGGFTFNQGGSTLVNELGGVIRTANGTDPFNTVVITGSAGDDNVRNAGLVSGLVRLGAGADRYATNGLSAYERVDLGEGDDRFEYVSGGYSPFAEGGTGIDTFAATSLNQQLVYGNTVTGFEKLSLAGNGQFFNFSGYQSIVLGAPVQFGLGLGDSDNPLVDLNLGGNSIRLYRSSLKTITGGDTAETVELATGSSIGGKVALGGGDDRFVLFSSGSDAPPTLPTTGVDGGTGRDTFQLQLSAGMQQSLDLAKVTGFEVVSINSGYEAAGSATLKNVAGVIAIDVGSTASLSLIASQLPTANVTGGFGGSISLDAGSSIGRYGFPLDGPYDRGTDLMQGDDRLSVILTNQGQIAGDVVFYLGDDRYDGSAGSVGGKVYGNAGNDTLIGGGGNEWFEGGYGTDTLVGGGGADHLDGGANADRIIGGSGQDFLIGGSGADTFLGSRADISGDRIVDLALGDRIVISDAALPGFGYSYSGETLRLNTGETLTLSGFNGRFAVSAAPEGGVALTVDLVTRLQNDFNGDGRSDVFWRETGGAFTDWLGRTDGGLVNNDSAAYRAGVSVDWRVAGTGDFNGDGRSDVLWRNNNGSFTDWLGQANGSFSNNDAAAFQSLSSSWNVAAVDDFNGDGRADALFRNSDGRGMAYFGRPDGALANSGAAALFAVPTEWQIVGSGDFNADGRADILWRNQDGRLTDWLGRADGSFANNDSAALSSVPSDWRIAGTGDFNGDGFSDILWRNKDGALSDWLGRSDGGFTNNDTAAFATVPTNWHVADTGDYNGDGRFDILWRNDNGDLTTWLGRADGGFANNDAHAFMTVPTNWQIQPEPPVL